MGNCFLFDNIYLWMAGVSIFCQTASKSNTSSKGEHQSAVVQRLEHPSITEKNPSTNNTLSGCTLGKFVRLMLFQYVRVPMHRMHASVVIK